MEAIIFAMVGVSKGSNKLPLVRDVPKGQVVTWADVRVDEGNEAVKIRRQMERRFAI